MSPHVRALSSISPWDRGLNQTGSLGVLGTSFAWDTANGAYYYPVIIPGPLTVVKFWVRNGNVVSGNIDIGLYDQALTRLSSAGSTVQSGVNLEQEFDVADFLVGPGLFYLAVAMDNTTGRTFASNTANQHVYRMLGILEQANAFPLPVTATPQALSASRRVIACGLLGVTLL